MHPGGCCAPARASAEKRPAHGRQGSLSRAHLALAFLVYSCEDGSQPTRTQQKRKETAPLSTPTHCQLQTRSWAGLEKQEQVQADRTGRPRGRSPPYPIRPCAELPTLNYCAQGGGGLHRWGVTKSWPGTGGFLVCLLATNQVLPAPAGKGSLARRPRLCLLEIPTCVQLTRTNEGELD